MTAQRHLNLIEKYRQEHLRIYRDLVYYNPESDITNVYLTDVNRMINLCSVDSSEDCLIDICKLKGIKQAYESLNK
jgi:hypothetical protein